MVIVFHNSLGIEIFRGFLFIIDSSFDNLFLVCDYNYYNIYNYYKFITFYKDGYCLLVFLVNYLLLM